MELYFERYARANLRYKVSIKRMTIISLLALLDSHVLNESRSVWLRIRSDNALDVIYSNCWGLAPTCPVIDVHYRAQRHLRIMHQHSHTHQILHSKVNSHSYSLLLAIRNLR